MKDTGIIRKKEVQVLSLGVNPMTSWLVLAIGITLSYSRLVVG